MKVSSSQKFDRNEIRLQCKRRGRATGASQQSGRNSSLHSAQTTRRRNSCTCMQSPQEPSPVAVRSYAWIYTWPLDQAQGPAPSQKPIQCPSGQSPHFPNPHALQQPQHDAEVEERMKMLRELGPKAHWQRSSYTV